MISLTIVHITVFKMIVIATGKIILDGCKYSLSFMQQARVASEVNTWELI